MFAYSTLLHPVGNRLTVSNLLTSIDHGLYIFPMEHTKFVSLGTTGVRGAVSLCICEGAQTHKAAADP